MTSTPAFGPASRYHLVETATWRAPDGRVVVYLTRRFCPPPERLAQVGEHTVRAGERIDTIAAIELGDPEQFWRICDANAALHPAELTEELGRRLRITLPDGIPGAGDG